MNAAVKVLMKNMLTYLLETAKGDTSSGANHYGNVCAALGWALEDSGHGLRLPEGEGRWSTSSAVLEIGW